jgi:hypothetical protein
VTTALGFASEARGARCHAYVDGTHVAMALAAAGIVYDSSPLFALQPHLVPLRHWTGIMRLPVFWEDDVHWTTQPDWAFLRHRDAFLTPGLKVIDVHPFLHVLNIANGAARDRLKPLYKTITRGQIKELRYGGRGSADFLADIWRLAVGEGCRILTLGEIFDWAAQSVG